MVDVNLVNSDTDVLTSVFSDFVDQPASFTPPSSGYVLSDADTAYNAGGLYGQLDAKLTGIDFSYDPNGMLVGGTITGVLATTEGAPDDPAEDYSSETFTGLSLPVTDMLLLAPTLNPAPAVLTGDLNVVADSPSVHTYAGNDTIDITGGGTAVRVHFDGYQYPTTTSVDAGGGVNTVALSNSFRDQATIVGGGGGETADIQPGVFEYLTTATLTAVDKIQFIDGSVFEDNATPDAQAADHIQVVG